MNRLQHEKSPYLLQHKNNPVDWFPWGEEAFEKAKSENKPVFLSIGYATCHWCHVMEHESFEDKDIASQLNDNFINIKVDREERPDIDSTYMTVCQMITGQGGWPLTIIMTPDKRPFFAGTYIPKEAKFQRIGLKQLIPGISGMWKNEPEKIQKATESIQDGFNKSLEFESGLFPGLEAVDYAAEQLTMRYDEKFGGFGSSPKFPSPHNLNFLLRQWYATGEDRFKDAVENTLIKMRLGGIWDHIGFGFHRYSTDREWLVPHFEKMLYDQALLMDSYTEGWQVTGNPLFKQTVYEIADYVERKLTDKDGGFFSAEDADTDNEEGKFYIWSEDEINQILDQENATFLKSAFNFSAEGNYEDEATKQKTGKNIPHLTKILSGKENSLFKEIRDDVLSQRETRNHPLLDDKILADWNALMISALAKAGKVFGEKRFISAAEKAFEFIQHNMIKDHVLYHRFKEGETSIHAFADDYAFLIQASIELYESTFDTKYLEHGIAQADKFISEFWDYDNGGFFLTHHKSEELLGRQKQIYDGAIPSSNSIAMLSFIKLSRITGNPDYENYANSIGEYFSSDLIRSGSSITHGLQAVQYLNNTPRELVIATPNSNNTWEDLFGIAEIFSPFKVVLLKQEKNESLTKIVPFTAEMDSVNENITFYLCSNFVCNKPFNDIEELRNHLTPDSKL